MENAKLRGHTGPHGGILSGIPGRPLVHEGTCNSLPRQGELETELADGQRFAIKAGDSYQTADGEPGHRSSTRTGARLFIVD